MFRRAGNTLKPQLRRLHGQASSSTHGARQAIRAGTFVSSSVLVAYVIWQSNSRVIHNDTGSPVPLDKSKERSSSLLPCGNVGDLENLHTVVWGSNRCRLLSLRFSTVPNKIPSIKNRSNTLVPDAVENIRTLSIASALDGVALRDLVLHKSHAACVDAHGDVYQWGSGFSGSGSENELGPTLTLRNKVRRPSISRPTFLETRIVEHCATETDRWAIVCTFRIWKGICDGDRCRKAKTSSKSV
jgi:hypothetical protein